MKRAVTAAAAALLVGAVACGSDDRVDRARAILDDRDRFETGQDAVAAFARVTSLLGSQADACVDDHRAEDVRCAALLEASAYAQVTAVAIAHCTRPHRDETRRAASRYLAAVARVTPGRDRPQPPPPPAC